MHISIVICTRNRPYLIGNAVSSVLAQSYADYDVLVVDQSTDDRTGARVAGTRDHRQHGHDPERDAEQPAVADADLTPAGRDPAEEEPAGRPLREERREVELHR